MPRKSKADKKKIEHLLIQKQTELAALLAEQQLVEKALEKDLQLEMLEAAKTNFKSFFVSAWDLIEPGKNFLDNWSIDCIADHLQAVHEGQIQNLILQVPPRHAKSSLASVAYPCWVWLSNPHEKFITASAIEKLVLRDAVRSRRLLGTEWYKKLNPELSLLPDTNQKGRYENNQGGYRYATSIGSSVIGEGYSTLICLPYDQVINTNKGLLKIGDIVEHKIDCQVYTFNHSNNCIELNSIERFEKNPRFERKIVEVKTSSGKSFKCTEDHPLFVIGKGYNKAIECQIGDKVVLYESANEDLQRLRKRISIEKQPLLLQRMYDQVHFTGQSIGSSLRQLWKTVQKDEQGHQAVKAQFLLQNLYRSVSEKFKDVCKKSRDDLCSVWQGFYGGSVLERGSSILLKKMQWFKSTYFSRDSLPALSNYVYAYPQQSQILWHGLQECSPFSEYEGRIKFQLQARRDDQPCSEEVSLSSRIWKKYQGASKRNLQPSMCNVRYEGIRPPNESSRTSHRLEQTQQYFGKLSGFVSLLSRYFAWKKSEKGKQSEIVDEFITEISTTNDEPEFVYNIATRNHNYFCADVLVHNCDDLLRPQDITSKAVMERTLEWWTQSISTRRNSPEAKRILIMQRLHEMDPIGYELSSNPDIWTNVMLPMEYDPARKLISTIGWEDPRKEDGEILWPERFPPKEVANLKKALGVFGWSSQYNQNPIPREGGLIKKNWVKYYFQPINKFQLVQFELIIGSWDLTFTDTGSSDCCGTVWGKRGTDKYLLACYKEKMDVVQQLAAIRKMKADFPGIRAMLIEKKANGDAVIRMLQKEIPGLIAISPQEIGGGDKEVRLAACSIEYEAGNVYFPDKSFAPWVSEVVSELINFPKAASDDFVDSSTQALNWLSTKSGLSSINITATAEQLRHDTGISQDYDYRRRQSEAQLAKTSAKMITEASSQNISSLKSIFS